MFNKKIDYDKFSLKMVWKEVKLVEIRSFVWKLWNIYIWINIVIFCFVFSMIGVKKLIERNVRFGKLRWSRVEW